MKNLLSRIGISRRLVPITIVSGLPRSGTSLMMNVLNAGGLTLLTDQERRPDTDNPRGYFEFERAKGLPQGDVDWLKEVGDRVVKVISALLMQLPPTYEYRVLFMRRDLDEILISQQKMLANRNELKETGGENVMKRHYQDHLAQITAWLDRQKNFEMISISYNELITEPVDQLKAIDDFLYQSFDANKAATAIDRSLYRNRAV